MFDSNDGDNQKRGISGESGKSDYSNNDDFDDHKEKEDEEEEAVNESNDSSGGDDDDDIDRNSNGKYDFLKTFIVLMMIMRILGMRVIKTVR